MFRIEEDGRKWLGRPKLCTKICRAVLRRSAQGAGFKDENCERNKKKNHCAVCKVI